MLACGKHDVCVQSPMRPRYHNRFKHSISWSFLVLPPSQLPHQEHATALAALTLRPRRVANRRLRAWVPRRSRSRTIIHLRRARCQLSRRAEPATGELHQECGVRTTCDAGELTSEGRCACTLRRDAAKGALVTTVRRHEGRTARRRGRAATSERKNELSGDAA